MLYGKGQRKTLHMLLVVLVLSPIVIMPLSIPVMSNMIVVMYDDAATTVAVKTLTENTPNVKVVQYNTLDFALTIDRVIGQVVWVSHGSEEGILTQNGILSWYDFSSMIERSPNRDIILACQSSEIYDTVERSEAIGFTGSIEASLGALLVSIAISGIIPTEAIVSTIDGLVRGSLTPHILELTMLEFAWDTVSFMIGLLLFGAGILVTQPIVNALINMVGVLFINVFVIAGGVMGGYYSPLDLILPLISLMLSIAVGLAILLPQYSALILLQTAVLSTPFGYFLIAVNIGVYIGILYLDWLD